MYFTPRLIYCFIKNEILYFFFEILYSEQFTLSTQLITLIYTVAILE